MFCYQKNFSNPTLPVDEAQFYALVRAKQWNENIDKYRKTGEASLKRKLPAFIFQATFDETDLIGLYHTLWAWLENRFQSPFGVGQPDRQPTRYVE